jgi:hypothetical protein
MYKNTVIMASVAAVVLATSVLALALAHPLFALAHPLIALPHFYRGHTGDFRGSANGGDASGGNGGDPTAAALVSDAACARID